MKNNLLIPFLFITFIILLIDLYTFKGIKLLCSNLNEKLRNSIYIAFWLVPIVLIVSTGLLFFVQSEFRTPRGFAVFYYIAGFLVLFYVPKLTFIVFHLTEDIFKLIVKLISLMFDETSIVHAFYLKVKKFKLLSQIGIITAIIPFFAIIYGILILRFDYRVNHQVVAIKDLPPSFNNFRIVHISDIHIGSFYNHSQQIEKAVEMINSQTPDLILFTGDMVNNTSDELEPYVEIFSKMQARKGKFSVLGNHDYGEYYNWRNIEEKRSNLKNLIALHQQIGFRLLLNESERVSINGDEIAILGVENWGQKPFPQYGNFDKAVEGVETVKFKILLSHDPSHWEEKILKKTDVNLTLAGHTHGFQFGIEIGDFKWSPAQWKYPLWAGLYKEGEQYLYVNRGLGFIGFPGRVGIAPEITLIELVGEN